MQVRLLGPRFFRLVFEVWRENGVLFILRLSILSTNEPSAKKAVNASLAPSSDITFVWDWFELSRLSWTTMQIKVVS